ncbi:DUF2877 domain-containing protein [Marinilactibacillus kalidii]|uniref:DUF2877 domain-containing protein n=1 Tax=Marinilactibacillus kalidii TaxID=2820274 RepID=UPI001ABE00B7|nr:DUF2877 domain-containing protein [Marinilactibacillus kalidii]
MISAYLLPLSKFGNKGTIHSVFNRSFNILVNQQLINITNYSDYFSSFGIRLSTEQYKEMFPYIQQGNLVKIKQNTLIIYSTVGVYTLNVDEMKVIDLNVRSFKLTKNERDRLRQDLEKRNLPQQIGIPMDDKTRERLEALKSSSKDWKADWEKSVHFLTGRGHGLTPSGDDMLVAFLAILHAAEDERVEVLASTLLRTRFSTTDISRAYIEASIEGYVNSRVYNLLSYIKNGLDSKRLIELEALLQIGHFSGKDLAYGMLLALQNIDENEKG